MKYNESDLVLERFHDGESIKVGNLYVYVEVYINPNSLEILDCTDAYGVRLGIDSNLNLYSWNSSVLHYDITKAFGIDFCARLIYNKYDNTIEISGYGVNAPTTDFINNNINVISERLKVAFHGRDITFVDSSKKKIQF